MRHLFNTICLALTLFLQIAFAPTAQADSLPIPTGPVLLTVSGDLTRPNHDGTAAFDLTMLENLPRVSLVTETIWTTGTQTFEGVRLQDVMKASGVAEGRLKAFAINDYAVDIPFDDVRDGSAIIAFMRNGSAMSVRDKGPLWIVYPFDEDARFRSEVYYSRSIWQLDRIHVTR
jgi:hypothetical protein